MTKAKDNETFSQTRSKVYGNQREALQNPPSWTPTLGTRNPYEFPMFEMNFDPSNNTLYKQNLGYWKGI
jgi:hypothetical protein